MTWFDVKRSLQGQCFLSESSVNCQDHLHAEGNSEGKGKKNQTDTEKVLML